MKITTKAQWKSMDDFLAGKPADAEQSFEYSGVVGLCDRQLQAQATQNAKTAGQTAAGYGSSASADSSAVTPFYTSELKAKHGFDPTQINELLTAAEAGAGGAAGSITGQAGLEAARTRNASGFTKSLDEAARDKDKALAASSEGIAGQDVMGAKELNQEGAAGLQGLYGTNVNAQLKAMGQQNEDVNTAIEAGKSGWLQNMTGVIGALGSAAQGAGSVMQGISKMQNP